MAVRTSCNGEYMYEGCVLRKFERNGYEDSDFYALCWDENCQEVVEVEYASTRAGGCGDAKIDITFENLLKVYRYYWNEGRRRFEALKYSTAKKIEKGNTVIVKRGRKVPVGTTGTVFWLGTRYNQYSRKVEDRVGIEVGGERLFLPVEYVERTDWESNVVSGKKRKRFIRTYALSMLPGDYQYVFIDRRTGRTRNIGTKVNAVRCGGEA